jgi:hypothetical protein
MKWLNAIIFGIFLMIVPLIYINYIDKIPHLFTQMFVGFLWGWFLTDAVRIYKELKEP